MGGTRASSGARQNHTRRAIWRRLFADKCEGYSWFSCDVIPLADTTFLTPEMDTARSC